MAEALYRRTTDDFNLNDDELVAALQAMVETKAALTQTALVLLQRLYAEAKRRELDKSPLVDSYTRGLIGGFAAMHAHD